MRHRKYVTLFCAVALSTLNLVGCTSPGSVRSLSSAQAERLDVFSKTLHAAFDAARDDRQVRLEGLILAQELDIGERELELGSKADQDPALKEMRFELTRLRKELDRNDAAYASLTEYVDRVLIPGNTALDEWHHRSGVALMDSDSVASWAQTISTTGITEESLRDVTAQLKVEAKDEFAVVRAELRGEFEAEKAKLEESLNAKVEEGIAKANAEIQKLQEQLAELKKQTAAPAEAGASRNRR